MKSEKLEKLSRFFSDKTKGKINESNLKYCLAGFAVIVVLIVVVIVLVVKGSGKPSTIITETGESVESSVEAETDESIMNEASEAVLEENVHAEINQLMAEYLRAVADGDIETVRTIEYPLTEMNELFISARSEYIENFENITVYTMVGPTEGSYIVFVYIETKFYQVETTAPAIYPYYVKQNEEGNYFIFNGEISEAEEEYIIQISDQDDLMDLFAKVNVKFQEAIDQNPELARLLAELPDEVNESIGTAVAELNTVEEGTEASEALEEENEEAEVKDVDFETVRATSAVNVRSAASEDASKLGKLSKDENVKRIESLENGWSCIEYKGEKGYVKSEYLTVSSVTYKDGTVENLSGTCTPTTTINVRASASENADKIGIANAGETLKLLEILENGWTKVEYQGKEAYVKSEYLAY